jgi:YidC/Oxa1 family membrane protein insertase
MGNKNRFAFIYLIIGVAFLFGWGYVQNLIWPPVPKPKVAKPEEVHAFVVGGPAVALHEVDLAGLIDAERKKMLPDALGTLGGSAITVTKQAGIFELIAAERRKALIKPAEPPTLIAMGKAPTPYHLQVLLNTRGGSIQQVVLTHFQQADREGLVVKNSDGTPKPLHLIPGVRVPRTQKIRDQRTVEVPELSEGKLVLDNAEVEHPSYVMYHYEKESDFQPVDTLGNREWKVVRRETSDDGNSQLVAFEIDLGAPFYVKITKTFTLKRDEYHIGLTVAITPFERPAGVKVEPFRYQIDGPRGMPIEGEWYTTMYRQGIVGWQDSRALEDARQVRHLSGSDQHKSTDKKPIRYAGVMVQYFASILALDNVQPSGQRADYIEYVRFTPEGEPHRFDNQGNRNPQGKIDQTFLDDLTSRAVSRPIDPSVPVTHSYVLYQGPVKVRLLKQLEGAQAVPEETVNRYRDDLALNRMTDAPMPNWLGRFANFIFWTDIVIAFTNLIHWLLGLLSHLIPNAAICIILITMMVRAVLHPFSRKQMIKAKIMQAKQEKLAPEIKRLTELYGDDFQRLNQEKMKLYREHGINPAAAMGGCFLLLAQMPIFMGLYYALQESVFFRLESVFGDWWIPNLAAPDMLFWWTESIPFISHPEDLGGMVYLGPYFNLLPVIAVGLMMYVQAKMMPKSEDPQIQMQQKTMKIMMILMLFFFYKSPAGLAIYFICSSVWGMIERRLLPKNIQPPEDMATAGLGPKDKPKPQPAEPKGWLGKKMASWREKWDKILEEAQKQQQILREQRGDRPSTPGPSPGTPPGPGGPGRKKKKKKR